MVKVALVIPSIRKFEYWNSYKKAIENSNFNIDIYVCGEEVDVNPQIDKVLYSNPKWRKSFFGKDNLWLFPAFTRHVNSIYAYIIVKRLNYDMIITVDDDTECSDFFFEQHWQALNQHIFPNYENVFESDRLFPRGFPYSERNKGNSSLVVFNQGLWSNIPDLNAHDYAIWNNNSIPLKLGNHIAPIEKGITISSMNVAFRPVCLRIYCQPIAFNRFDDIWAGLILKKILDECKLYISYGYPFVKHNKYARNIWEDNKKEAEGHELNEQLWHELKRIKLHTSWNAIWYMYKEIADKLPFPAITKYMKGWINLINKKGRR